MMVRSVILLAAMGASAAWAAPAAPSAETIVLDRQRHMEDFNAAMQALGQQIMSKAPSRAIVREQAGKIAGMAPHIPGWFPAGSGAKPGIETKALPVIWQQPKAFVDHAAALAAASKELASFAQAGDMKQLLGKAMAVDKACVACHRAFRAPE